MIAFAPDVGPANAVKVIQFERSMGFFWEPAWQQWAVSAGRWLPTLLNWVYVLGFFPLGLAIAFTAYFLDRRRYLRYRNVIFVSFAVALVVFVLLPLAPPRLTEGYGFIDTIALYGPAWYDTRNSMAYYNAFAAMPSLHFGWACLFGAYFFRSGSPWLKAVGVAYPAAMFLAITVTGNHYIVDGIAGILLIGASFLAYNALAGLAAMGHTRQARGATHR